MELYKRHFLKNIMIVFTFIILILLTLDAILHVSNDMNIIGKYGYTWKKSILSLLLTTPRKIYFFLSWITLGSTIFAVAYLHHNNEIIGFRSCGVGLELITKFILKILIIIAILGGLIGEIIVPCTEPVSKKIKEISSSYHIYNKSKWYNGAGGAAINVKRAKNSKHLLGIKIHEFKEQKAVRSIEAQEAIKHKKTWYLYNVKVTSFNEPDDVQSFEYDKLATKTLNEINVSIAEDKLDRASIYHLISMAKKKAANKHEVSEYFLAIAQKVLRLILVITMPYVALPFVIISTRSKSIVQSLLLGFRAGFILYVISHVLLHFFKSNNILMVIAIALPNVIGYIISTVKLIRS